MITLNPQIVWVDALAFTGLDSVNGNQEYPEKFIGKVITLYCGHFLAKDKAAHWTISLRESLRSKFLGIVTTQGARLEEAGK